MSKSIFITQEGPANALALNKDYTHVVIAGRNVFKIFTIEEDEFVESCNLRVGKNLNLNFSCNDVAWNTVDDHILATAATNGAVVVWNLNRPSRSKQEHVFVDHKRTVNKVCFNRVEPTWLISGSQDGTMKTFDLRAKIATNTFYSNTESVRDVQFSPHSHISFASVSENGNVQTWDVRRPDKPVLQFTAHSGPIFACDWHPENSWLATASRDKMIKVWDISGRPSLEYTINTIASVGRVKWRPQHKYHIASVALVVDCSVNVWDVRRPYIPYAVFTPHKDVATGITWRSDPNLCLTTSRDCTLYQHVFKDAIYPALHANPQALAISPQGNVAFACRVNISHSKPSKIPGIFRRATNNSEEFRQAQSVLTVYTRQANKEVDWLITCAKRYILSGKPLADICLRNSSVAQSLGRLAVSLVWKTVQIMYTVPNEGGCTTPPIEEVNERRVNIAAKTISGESGKEVGDNVQGDSPALELDTETEVLGDLFFIDQPNQLSEPTKLDGLVSQDWTLPVEAFAPKAATTNRAGGGTASPSDQASITDTPDSNDEGQPEFSGLMVSKYGCGSAGVSWWDHCATLAAALRQHAEMGDVQTAVCVLVSLGDKRTQLLSHIDVVEQEAWLVSYLDLLSRHRLWVHSTEIIKLSWISNISELNQQSTTVYTGCSQCNKPLNQTGWLCTKCDLQTVCSVCHQTVHGLYVWCQGCMHGGHIDHMKDWITNNTYCPTGCGHPCEFS
ncbi:WD repeat domain 24 isoform X1 [Rhodnius prolixus]